MVTVPVIVNSRNRNGDWWGTGVVAGPKASVEEGESVPQQTLGKPFVEVQWEMLHHNPSILYFRTLLLQLQVIANLPHIACELIHLLMILCSMKSSLNAENMR